MQGRSGRLHLGHCVCRMRFGQRIRVDNSTHQDRNQRDLNLGKRPREDIVFIANHAYVTGRLSGWIKLFLGDRCDSIVKAILTIAPQAFHIRSITKPV